MWPSASSSSSSSASSYLIHGLSSRRLLLHTPLYSTDKAAPPNPGGHTEPYIGDSSFDANIVMILSVLLCALICALGLNSIIRCALRCSSRVTLDSSDSSSTRLANTGVKRKALKMFPTIIYSADLKLPGLDKECSICLSEFTLSERLRVLPKCNHGFHGAAKLAHPLCHHHYKGALHH
ncbi:Ring-h2 finger protein atl78 [Thalictrum thalictroides]|uniref:Ring-h2 finger protein atl78 n=1 Tax=Thalictrum thalictroides TaxID=46969 RepID=A0A7J6VVT5_THATH|nr:Ring-h2 finger protein atl78 [Thalictrum thalictroides]